MHIRVSVCICVCASVLCVYLCACSPSAIVNQCWCAYILEVQQKRPIQEVTGCKSWSRFLRLKSFKMVPQQSCMLTTETSRRHKLKDILSPQLLSVIF